MLKVLDLFAGTGSATQAFKDRGHQVVTVELDGSFPDITYYLDVRRLAKDPDKYLKGWRPDVMWASSPCTAFSMGGKGSDPNNGGKGSTRWDYRNKKDPSTWDPFYGPRVPTDSVARSGCALALATVHLARILKPRYWWMENPMGGLKSMGFMRNVPGPVIVSYCQYGDKRQKMTTLWGVWPETWVPRPKCKNGDSCHEASPRGSRTGTQGLEGPREREHGSLMSCPSPSSRRARR